jgi:hypothetical protein
MKQIIAIIVTLPIVYLVALFAASEWGGEVIKIETYDVRGRKLETSVWVVHMQGDLWIRAGDPEAAWVQRLQAEPDVFVTRQGVRTRYRGELVEDYAREINEAMREKYGRADMLVSTIHDSDEVLAIRLVEP